MMCILLCFDQEDNPNQVIVGRSTCPFSTPSMDCGFYERVMPADLSSLDGWEFGNLPRPRLPCEPPRALPPSLGELLHVQPTLLRQLSHVKLRILARAYQRVYPDDSKGLSEHDLYARMRAAIQVCPQLLPLVAGLMIEHMVLVPINAFICMCIVRGNDGWQAACRMSELLRLMMQSVVSLEWQPSPPMLPEVPAGWAGEVTACVSHWLLGWGRGSRGRAMNVCCHDGRWGQTSVLCPTQTPCCMACVLCP